MEQRRSVCIPQTDMLPDNIFHRRRGRSRSSSANCRRDRENTISAKTTKKNFYRRHSYVSSPFFRTENSRAEKSISPSNIERSSRTSNIAIAKRQNLRDGTSNIGERPSRETGSNSSRSTLRCQSACRSTSRSSCSSSSAFNINRRRSTGHERKKEKDTRVKSATFYGDIVNSNGRGNEGKDTEHSRCHKMKNIKRVNNDGENNVRYGGGDGKEEDIIQLEKRLNSIRRLTRDLEMELQCRRDKITGHDGHCSDSRNCGDSDNDVDNTSLLTLRLSNRCIDKDNANSNDYKSQVEDNGDDKRIDKPNLTEPTINAANHISHSSKNAPVPKNTKERKRNTYFGRHPESQQHAASQTPSETTRPQLDWRYSRRASTGGVLEDYLSMSCQPKNPASPFQEFKDEKTSIFLKYTCDADSHLKPAASGNLSKYLIVVDNTDDTVSSLSYSSDGNNNKNSVLTTPSKFQENKEGKDRQQCSDLVQVRNCQGKESQATVYSSPLYLKIERCLNDHENLEKGVNVQSSTLLLTEKNNLKTTATSAIDILPSSVINRAHPPPPPPRKTAPSTSSTPPPSSLPSSLSAHCSSQKSPHFFNQARATDNDSDPTASTSSSTANSSNLSRPSTPTECIPFIQTFQMLHQNTLMGSNLGGYAKKCPCQVSLVPVLMDSQELVKETTMALQEHLLPGDCPYHFSTRWRR